MSSASVSLRSLHLLSSPAPCLPFPSSLLSASFHICYGLVTDSKLQCLGPLNDSLHHIFTHSPNTFFLFTLTTLPSSVYFSVYLLLYLFDLICFSSSCIVIFHFPSLSLALFSSHTFHQDFCSDDTFSLVTIVILKSPPLPSLLSLPYSIWKQMLFVRSYHYWLIKQTSLLSFLQPAAH